MPGKNDQNKQTKHIDFVSPPGGESGQSRVIRKVNQQFDRIDLALSEYPYLNVKKRVEKFTEIKIETWQTEAKMRSRPVSNSINTGAFS